MAVIKRLRSWTKLLWIPRGGSSMISEGVRFHLISLPYLLFVFGKTGLRKQCRPSDVWSGPAQFATRIAILHTFIGSKMDLLKRNIRKRVRGLTIQGMHGIICLSKSIPNSHENEILSQRTPLNLPCHITKTRLFKYIEKFTNKNWKFSDKKNSNMFSHFCSKHRLWVPIRTSSPRRF